MNNKLILPISIVLAGVIIAGAIIFMGDRGPAKATIKDAFGQQAVTKDDHIRGNPNAPIVMVEYSDLECPYCKNFHTTMHTLMDTYGKSGDMAWVYRHFPLSFHTKAQKEAEATECIAEQLGEDKFWDYVDQIYAITPSNNKLEASELPRLATAVGADLEKFNECLVSGQTAPKVAADITIGREALGPQGGTPHTLILLKKPVTANDLLTNLGAQASLIQYIEIETSGLIIHVNGALPLEMMKALVDAILIEVK